VKNQIYYRDVVAAVLQRFPQLAVVKMTPEDIGRGTARVEHKVNWVFGVMSKDSCSIADAIAKLD
jgi:hypothetical protein